MLSELTLFCVEKWMKVKVKEFRASLFHTRWTISQDVLLEAEVSHKAVGVYHLYIIAAEAPGASSDLKFLTLPPITEHKEEIKNRRFMDQCAVAFVGLADLGFGTPST